MEVDQELNMKFQIFEQKIIAIQQQLYAVEQAIVDVNSLDLGLGELIGKKDNEIFAPIGRGIYAKAKLISEELLVDIGEKNFVTKSIPETKKLIQEQIKKLEDVKEELNNELEKINEELTKAMIESQHEHKCNCKKGEECNCEKCGDDCECEHDDKHECKDDRECE